MKEITMRADHDSRLLCEARNKKLPMVKPSKVNLRNSEFKTAECEYCVYWKKGDCKVLERPVRSTQVCDAYQGAPARFKKYKLKAGTEAAFIQGMVKMQPYQHRVIQGIETPVGWLVIIEDTMEPKAHRFSLPMKFHIEHTSREHHWTQTEVNRLIVQGR